MNNKHHYQDTFAQVRFRGQITPERMENKNRHNSTGRIFVLAAAVCLLTALGITAGAAGMFGLQGMVLRPEQEPSAVAGNTDEKQDLLEVITPEKTYNTIDTLSLSGFAGSPEKQAVAEWQQFLGGYDTDHKILNTIGNQPTGLEEKYGLYSVYTQQMADRLEEITSKYGLRLHTSLSEVPGTWEQAAAGTFLHEEMKGFYGYMYEDGSFHFDGEWNISEDRILHFQFGRWVKGSFNEVVLNIGNAEEYREWTYVTACGIPVTLAVGSSKSLVLTEMEDAIITINVLEGTERDYMGKTGGMTGELLEALADSIDFNVLSPVRAPVLPFVEQVEQTDTDWLFNNVGITETAAQEFYCAFYRAVENDLRREAANMIAWPRNVKFSTENVLISSAEEFLPYYEYIFTSDVMEAMLHNQYTKDRADLFALDGQICGAGGEIRFGMENGEIKIQTVQIPDTEWGIYVPLQP